MHRRRNSSSDSDRRTRRDPTAVEQLLFSRKQTAQALGGISIATVQRLEKAGKLTKVRLAGVENGAVFHRADEVHALAGGDAAQTRAKCTTYTTSSGG